MNKERQEELIKLLTEKGAIQPCPRCTNPQFELLGESSVQLHDELSSKGAFGPIVIPAILVACKNCGYITQHAERILDPTAQLRF